MTTEHTEHTEHIVVPPTMSSDDAQHVKQRGSQHVVAPKADTSVWYTVVQASQKAVVCQLHIRQLAKKGTLTYRKDHDGHILISGDSLNQYIAQRDAREKARVERIASGTTASGPTRPTERTYETMVKAIKADSTFSVDQRALFLSAMERYKRQWDRAYSARKAPSNQ
jgi:hypothetical protein